MIALILGLVIFLGIHSVRIVADDWRNAQIAARGENVWKGVYSVAALIGVVLIVWGYGMARTDPVPLWSPPLWGRDLAWLLMAVSFVLIAQMHGRPGPIKARLHHPMLAAVIVWAVAHLMSNGALADLVLFGGFLVWAVVDLFSAIGRDRRAGKVYVGGPWTNDLIVVGLGVALYVGIVLYLHELLIGVSPLAR